MSCANETECFDVCWNIENLRECLFEEGISLGSPIFKTNTADGSSHTWWKLYLETGKSSLTVKLEKIKGVSVVSSCELSLSSVFGVIKMPREEDLTNDSCCRFTIPKFEVFNEKRRLNIPPTSKDIITVNCKICYEIIKPGQLLFGSILQKGSAAFHISSNCNSIIYDQDHLQMTMMTYENEICSHRKGCCGRLRLLVEILPSRGGWHSFVKSTLTCNNAAYSDESSIVSQNGRLTCSTRIWEICRSVIGKKFDFEFIVAVETISMTNPYSIPIPAPLENLKEPQLSPHSSSLKSEQVAVSLKTLRDDLLRLYSEKFLSDATLNTEGKTFPAHRNILSARSPVFRAMFEKDQMSEGHSGVVDIVDLDSTTVDRMLVFLYGDYLGNMNWEEASPLYYAADKYEILLLKEKCADILKANLAVDNACDALILADKHSEEQLMRCTIDFIRYHDKVLSSAKWEEFEDSNPRLAAKVTRELYLLKRKY